MSDQKQSSDLAKMREAERAKRLGDELRANLHKRKKQKRARLPGTDHNSQDGDS